MKATVIKIGKTYEVKAGRNTTTVKVESFNPKTGGWVCATQSGKSLNIKDIARFVREIDTSPVKAQKTGRGKGGKPLGKMSAIDAAHQVLLECGRPMNVREITEIAMQSEYCDLKGATPSLTISAALQRDIKAKGRDSRFVKTGKGLFAAR
jgi:hypothetical protein